MSAILQTSRDQRQAFDRLTELATKGLREPHQLTPDETQELCGLALRHAQRPGL